MTTDPVAGLACPDGSAPVDALPAAEVAVNGAERVCLDCAAVALGTAPVVVDAAFSHPRTRRVWIVATGHSAEVLVGEPVIDPGRWHNNW